MALESPVTYINTLVSTNPTGSDAKSAGDDHIRNIKTALLATFPNITAAVTATHTEINALTGITSNVQVSLQNIATAKAATVHTHSATEITTGTLVVDRGGTGRSSLTSAVQDLLDAISSTQGTLVFRGPSDWNALAPGTAEQVLKTGGTGANPSWGDATGMGVGQSYADVTASRDLAGTVFQNTSDLPILVLVETGGSAGTVRFAIGSTSTPSDIILQSSATGAGVAVTDTFIVPVNWYYKATVISGSRSLTKWYEFK